MKIKNIEELKSSINQSTFLFFAIVFSSVLVVLYITHNKFIQKRTLLNKQEISLASNIYKSNLSEKLSIIASSTVFLDYLRSGDKTRERLYSQFLSQLSPLKSKSIAGMQLIDSRGEILFDYGFQTPSSVTLKLCYLNQTLDSVMGDCRFHWKLYFNKSDLLNEIFFINNSIKTCQNCDKLSLIDNNEFGSFHAIDSSDLKLGLMIKTENDHFFNMYFFLMTLSLAIFGSWSWYRLSSILNNYISHPIKNLTDCLKTNNSLDSKNNIDEIQFLIKEINTWKLRLNKIRSDENAEKMGKIAAQLAHDVRSPLAAIGMLVKHMENIPEAYRITLRNATQRISDIANNFLSQYKKPQTNNPELHLSNEYIPSILEDMVSEKRSQYVDSGIEITLHIENDAVTIFAMLNPVDFKRVLSNLINNSIEAFKEQGKVDVTLIKLNDYLRIDIIDNGCGISSDLLPKIISGGISIGKRNGSGLGLSHAIKKIKEWHGNIEIKSEVGKGTKISIILPVSQKYPEWFKESLFIPSNSVICILDDEHPIHEKWKNKLKSNNYFLINHFLSPQILIKYINNNQDFGTIFLIDYDLGTDFSGLDIIKKYDIANRSTLVTNRHDDLELQNSCMQLGVKIIPKNLISTLHVEYELVL